MHDETLTLTAPCLSIHTEKQHPSHHLHKHITYFNTPTLKTPLSSTTTATQQTCQQTPHSHYNRHKTNLRHIHTSIVSRHLATRGNNKILRTPPPHIISSEERLPRLTRRTLAQRRTNKFPFLKSYLHKVDAKSHPSILCPHCNTHTHNTYHLFNCIHIRTTLSPLDGFVDRPRRAMALLAR